jgi:hypothetical protein
LWTIVQKSDGYFYGFVSGQSSSSFYQLVTNGFYTKILTSSLADPYGLCLGSDETLYAAAYNTLLKVREDGTTQVIAQASANGFGYVDFGGLTIASDGNIYMASASGLFKFGY